MLASKVDFRAFLRNKSALKLGSNFELRLNLQAQTAQVVYARRNRPVFLAQKGYGYIRAGDPESSISSAKPPGT